MFHVKDNKQGYIFDPFEYLGPKRLSELKNSWAEIFRSEILDPTGLLVFWLVLLNRHSI